MLAKDHKMKDLWQPEASLAGSKAALLAHKDGGKLDLWQHTPSSAGSSAATLAFRNKGLSPQLDRGGTETGRNNSLLAATMSVNRGRQRAGSTPTAPLSNYPDSQNSGKNALNAATASHRASVRSPDGWNSDANQAARIKNAHMDRELFTEDPNIVTQADIDDQRHQAALHASAASFAKSLYIVQKRGEVDPETSSLHDDDPGTVGAATAHRRNISTTSQMNIKEEAIRYIHLQDTAHRLAQERLAKVDKDMEAGRYREYYGYPNKSPRKSRLSMRGGRKRASSEGQLGSDDEDDERQARRIRQQMSQLSTGLDTVSDKQRQEDRARLLAAAEKRVHAQMHTMDEKVFMDTGKPSKAMKDEWEKHAREKAERDRVERDRNPGKTHIGGGKYMDDADIQAIAAARLKPTLDELNDTAEKKRARDEEMRAMRDAQETARMDEKMKTQEQKAEFKRIRGAILCDTPTHMHTDLHAEQDKAAAKREKEERKAAQRAEKEEAKVRKSEDKRKSREHKRDEVAVVAGGTALGEVADKVKTENDPEIPYEPSKAKEVETEPMREEPIEKEKEKSGRGMFDRIANRLKRQGDEAKRPEAGKPSQEVQREAVVEDNAGAVTGVAAVTAVGVGAAAGTGSAEDRDSEREAPASGEGKTRYLATLPPDTPSKPYEPDTELRPTAISDVHDESSVPTSKPYQDDEFKAEDRDAVAGVSALPGMSALDTGAQAVDDTPASRNLHEQPTMQRDMSEEPTMQRDTADTRHDLDDLADEDTPRRSRSSGRHKGVAVAAGLAAFGGIIAAGAMGAERRRKHGEEEVEDRDKVSSLDPTDDDEPSRPELQNVASSEHTGAYTFGAPAAGPSSRPDLERHISTIQDSTSDEADDESDGLSDSDDEDVYRQQTQARSVEEAPPVMVHASEETPARDRTYIINPTPDPQGTSSDAAREEPMPVAEPATQPTSSAVAMTELPRDEQGNIVLVNRNAPADAPHLAVQEEGAPAPAVKTGPSPAEQQEEPQQEKEKTGLRGLFSKLKGKSKADNKLHKDPPASERSEKAAPAAATASTAQPSSSNNDDTVITPVTTTTAGHEAQGDPVQHAGTDGPIGDPKHISGIGGEPRATSPSSFRRYDNTSRDLDDVSSSGADEDDYARGRGGRLAQKLGFSKGKSTAVGGGGDDDDVRKESLAASTSNGDEEQFEEARDHFDESLAPPPAFAGQAKSESPNRTTKFQEQL